jgi:hypothetical protein
VVTNTAPRRKPGSGHKKAGLFGAPTRRQISGTYTDPVQ